MKAWQLVLAGGLAVASNSVSAAIDFNFSGPIKIVLSNYATGTQYTGPNGTTGSVGNTPAQNIALLNLISQTPPAGAISGEDNWGILQVSQIIANDGSNVVLYDRVTAADEITAIFWGGQDTYLNQTGSGSSIVQQIHSVGIHAAFFDGNPKNYTGTAGPAARANSTGSLATNMPSYATVTDGSLLWTLNSVPGADASFPDDEFFTTYSSFLGGSATGGFFANVGSVPGYGLGPQNNNFTSIVGVPDVSVQFHGTSGTFGWLLNSDDTINAVVPEPASVSLMVLSSIGLLARRRNRSNSNI